MVCTLENDGKCSDVAAQEGLGLLFSYVRFQIKFLSFQT